MDIPVVLIHKTDHICLEYALRSVKQYNQNVTLITDIISGKYNNLAAVYDIQQFKNEDAEVFSKIYEHMSTNKYEFEFVCFERWFILLEFMKKYKLDEVIYIDSDIIIYDNLTEIIRKHYNEFDFILFTPEQTYESMNWASSGHTLYCKFNTLQYFCKFILETYKNNIAELMLKWKWHKENKLPGGINDMTLLYLFQKKADFKIGNFFNIINDNHAFDFQISLGFNEYEMEYSYLLKRKIKKIVFKKNQPYCYNSRKQKYIQFVSLHFQSDAKRIMQLYIKDNKTLKSIFADNLLTLKIAYKVLMNEMKKAHTNIKMKLLN